MSHQVPVVFEIDIKKKKLEMEIQQLEKELHRQEHKTDKQEHKTDKQENKKSMVVRSISPQSLTPTKDVKPAISQNWKQLFQLDPQLEEDDIMSYFPKQEYRVQMSLNNRVEGVFQIVKNRTILDWELRM